LQDGADRLFEIVRLALLHYQHRIFVLAEVHDLLGHKRISNVEDVDRDIALAKSIGEGEPLQGTQETVVHPALDDDADARRRTRHYFVELVTRDVVDRRRPARVDLVAFLRVGPRRQTKACEIPSRLLQRTSPGNLRRAVVFADETAVHVTGTNS